MNKRPSNILTGLLLEELCNLYTWQLQNNWPFVQSEKTFKNPGKPGELVGGSDPGGVPVLARHEHIDDWVDARCQVDEDVAGYRKQVE